ncbi:D-lyxose/D-mannose family sugar isomerase [Shewanella schlegeliana]|uniref:D-lyxose ketol-isomerase n=1 Tax=Shewanella schlegeliana TaxID=190308 RepID=A0ABS1SUU6_9GAMM|nr:D-lyxose/D-mannose family sugar isomerase [Shewanella schlegeliana]MBL4912100.1 D-lyxose/D-mannose family sugar isomerase [Shewanella schlegeliana]MCL1111302.1 D-lyxose/D-mannose family sugar isomerase [Shewanella schlegeliana]GIU32937.1 D-lyxose isomerase [Shewanella schlegeliana]
MVNIHDKITELLTLSGIFLTKNEIERLELTDFGLNDFGNTGLIIHTYINTERCCAKELIMLPHQVCPEHTHPSTATRQGKEETFRCRFGKVSVFIEGNITTQPAVELPKDLANYTVFHEVVLNKGEQLTLSPNAKHWFKAHAEGAIVSEFSTMSNDDTDVFTNQEINRASRLSV